MEDKIVEVLDDAAEDIIAPLALARYLDEFFGDHDTILIEA